MLTLNDGRNELWQWDTGRTLNVDAECSQVHFSNKVFGRSIDVDVVAGTAIIPDVLLQTDKDLNVWAFVGTAESGYTKISKTFKVNRRNKPADYVFTPPDQTSLEEIKEKIDYLESMQDPDAIKNAVEDYLEQNPVEAPVQSVNGQTGAVELTADDVGAISQDDLQEATNEALAQAKASGAFDGADGAPGKDGAPGADGKDGITPTIGENGNWYLGNTDTGKPSRGEEGPQGPRGETGLQGIQGPIGPQGPKGDTGETGPQGETGSQGPAGQTGADGKSAYQYAQDGGYTGTEAEFAAKLAEEIPDKLPNPNALTFTGAVTGSYDGSAPLRVEIPSGGGYTPLRKIGEIEILETGLSAWATYEITEDLNGEPISLDEFFILFQSSVAYSSGYMCIGVNGITGSMNLKTYAVTGYRMYHFAVISGELILLDMYANTANMEIISNSLKGYDKVNSIRFNGSAAITAAGGKVVVYGR